MREEWRRLAKVRGTSTRATSWRLTQRSNDRGVARDQGGALLLAPGDQWVPYPRQNTETPRGAAALPTDSLLAPVFSDERHQLHGCQDDRGQGERGSGL